MKILKSFKFYLFLSAALVISLSGCKPESTDDTNVEAEVSLAPGEILVSDKEQFNELAKSVKPGDTLVLKNGVYRDFEILFTGEGTEEQPITLRAEEKGGVIISGQSNLRLAGKYLVVEGLVFKDGYTPTSEVIAFRKNSKNLANHSRVTEVVIDDFSNPDKRETDYWVGLYGKHNRFDHSYLVGKRNRGVTVAVRLNSEDSQENYHRIDHNYFGPRPIFGSNGGETLRIGTSHFSLSDSHTIVENNYFDRCDGEVEIISVKSGKNILRNNVFFESRGTLTLRHGNGNLLESNVFFGNGVDHTGGIRVINADQTVRNNYFEGLTGYRFGSGFTIMNGVPDSPINRYHQVVNALVENNTLVNVEHVHLGSGSDIERSAVPKDSVFKNNLIFSEDKQDKFTIFDDMSGISFSGNALHEVEDPQLKDGFDIQSIALERADNGLLYPTDEALASIGASRDLKPIDKSEVGPDWYPKNELAAAFDSGKTITVEPGENTILNAAAMAESGDVLELAPGTYNEEKIIFVDKTITIKAKALGQATVKFYRSTFVEIKNRGSLKVEGLVIDGAEAPDSDGNTMIRTQKWGMYVNYQFIMKDTTVRNLDVNRNFHFFDAGAGSFADLIKLENVSASNVSGDILRLQKEIDDLGVYNAEYVYILNGSFENVQGALANVYRGGTDESTFGPHVYIKDSKVSNLGKGKRNKAKASVLLHGAQVSHVDNNQFTDSAGMIINHTVGEPITKVTSNVFDGTPAPVATEIVFVGPHTALIEGNTVK